jgi:hypothetical protein
MMNDFFDDGDQPMKQLLLTGLGVLATAGLIGIAGCDGGGDTVGMPKDTAQGVSQADMNKVLEQGKIIAPGQTKAAPPPGAPAPSQPGTPEKTATPEKN